MAGVAQLVEHRFVVPSVAGSSPVTRPINKKMDQMVPFFIYLVGSGENRRFDKIVGENEKNEVQAVTIWKGAHRAAGGWDYTTRSPDADFHRSISKD